MMMTMQHQKRPRTYGMEACLKRGMTGGPSDSDSDPDSDHALISPYKRLRISAEDHYPIIPQGKQMNGKTMKVLQSQGQIKLAVYMNFGLITVHVMQARQLSCKTRGHCDSYVKISMLPDDSKKTRCKSQVIMESNNPLYDEKFSFELPEQDHNKRLLLSVWSRDPNTCLSEFLGCMSFGVRHLLNPKKETTGWFYLLTEEIGKRKHLQVSKHRIVQQPQPKVRGGHGNIPSINRDVWWMDPLTINVMRGKHGFGFSVTESCPVRVGRVDKSSPAEVAGLQKDDCIIRINGMNVSRSTASSVVKIVRQTQGKLTLDIQRPHKTSIDPMDKSPWKPAKPAQPFMLASIKESPSSKSSSSYSQRSKSVKSKHFVPKTKICQSLSSKLNQSFLSRIHSNNKDSNQKNLPATGSVNCSLDDSINSFSYDSREHELSISGDAILAEADDSDPLANLPLNTSILAPQTITACERRKQEAVHRLMSIELDFIDFMHCGIERYSRPLRHCILTPKQHSQLFQNVEKLVTISEYHMKQMQDNAPSCSESDTTASSSQSQQSFGSQSGFISSIGLIYLSKVQLLQQAYDIYARGLTEASQVVSDLKRHRDFQKFIQDVSTDPKQPSLTGFVFRPVQHIKEMYHSLRDVFENSKQDSSDYPRLKQLVENLQECVMNITNYSCARSQSWGSLCSSSTSGASSFSSKKSSSMTSSYMNHYPQQQEQQHHQHQQQQYVKQTRLRGGPFASMESLASLQSTPC